MNRLWLYFASIAALSTNSSICWAQPATASGATVSGTQNGDTAPVTLQEIVVTAQHRSENLQKSAISISAVDSAALKQAGVVDPQDLTKLVPALQLSALGGGGTQVTIRGVGNFAPFIYNEPAVAVNYDGVYLARSAAPNGLFFDLDRVEVLDGPQGTLYGRNATGGAINIITSKPKLDGYSAYGEVEIGNYNLSREEFDINAPITSTAAIRIAAQNIYRDGYLSDGYSDDKGSAVRAELLYKPNSRLKVLLEADYIHQGGKGTAGVFVTPQGYINPSNPFLGPSTPQSNALLSQASLGITHGADANFLPQIGNDGRENVKIWGTSATIDYDLGFANLTFIPAYRKTDNDGLQYAGGFPVLTAEHSGQVSTELRLASSSSDKLKWVAGLYYFHDQSSLTNNIQQGATFILTAVPSLPVQSAAAFGQATYSLTERWRLTGGLRYTSEQKSQTGVVSTELPAVPTSFPAPPIVYYTNVACPSPGVVSLVASTCTANFNGKLTSDKLTWKAGTEFDLTPRSLLFFSVETGFKAGGFYPSTAPNTFQPEQIIAYTIGSKNRFFDNRVQININLYDWNYTNEQITHLGAITPGGFSLITQNAGKSTIAGAEFDLQWRPSRNDRFSANLAYTYSRYDQFSYTVPLLSGGLAATSCPQVVDTQVNGISTSTVNCVGRPLPDDPKLSFSPSYGHTFTIPTGSLDALVGTKVQSDYYTGYEYLPGEHQAASTVSYANILYKPEGQTWSLSVHVDNIEDTAIKSASFVQPVIGVPLVVLRPPRTYGVRFGASF